MYLNELHEMASISTIRSPTGADQSTDPCPFRRSMSRVFYESELTSPTSWEFCGAKTDSAVPMAVHPMELSFIRSPMNGVEIPILVSHSPAHQRSLSSPVKDELGGNGSDGSRNSTGSSSGSHRSQDSGFSDSGENRPSRRSNLSVHSPTSNLSANRSLANDGSYDVRQQQQLSIPAEHCNSLNQYDSNRNFLEERSQGRSPSSFSQVQELPFQQQVQQQPKQSIYSQNYLYERCYPTTPVPSPIPHSGAGCGKLVLRNISSQYNQQVQLRTNSPNPRNQHHDLRESNGNGMDCSNCIYQEIVLSKQSQSPQPHYDASQQHNFQCQNRSHEGSGNYPLYGPPSIGISPGEQNHRSNLGAPICCSTPKRSNISSSSTSRLTIMQKIDNFESLNKNKKLLDTNNNSSSSGHNNNNSGIQNHANISSDNGGVAGSICNQQTARTSTNLGTSFQSHYGCVVPFSPSSLNPELTVKCSSKTSLKKQQNLSLSALLSTSHNSSSTLSTSQNFANTENKTVVHRGCQQPKQSQQQINRSLEAASASRDKAEDTENNNYTLNEFPTYSSQPESKPCTKASPKWKSLPKGYKRVPVNVLNSSSILSTDLDASVTNPEERVIIVKSHFGNDAMRMWLHELRSQTEVECLHMLQTKSLAALSQQQDSAQEILSTETRSQTSTVNRNGLPNGSCSQEPKEISSPTTVGKGRKSGGARGETSATFKADKETVVEAVRAISSPLMSIKNVERMASVVSGEFAKICKNIEFGFLPQVPNLVLSLVYHVDDFLRTFQGSPSFGNLQKLENKLSRSCRRLHRSAKVMVEMSSTPMDGSNSTNEISIPQNSIYSIIEPETEKVCGDGSHVAVSEVVDGIVTVGNLFSQVVDLRLTRDLSIILERIEGGGVPSKVALKSFAMVLSDGGNHLCRLASEIRTVRGLLGVILDSNDTYDKMLALRCLATILCVGEAVKDFDRAGGFEIVADFMYDRSYPMELKIEAVSVLTQATDPWIDLETSLGSLSAHLEKIVVSLTNLIRDCQSQEGPFLLVVAAISNLTFLEVASIEILRRYRTVSLIIDAIQRAEYRFSIFVQDHVATILANMAGIESCRPDIVKSGGVHALLTFLHKRPTPSKESAQEIMACERVQQKSTIAISRLCTEDGVAQFILDEGGIHRLVMLSRNERERNYSDGVLIAALATLRKLVSICGDAVISEIAAEDLIQPRLLDSFLLYSSRQESYV